MSMAAMIPLPKAMTNVPHSGIRSKYSTETPREEGFYESMVSLVLRQYMRGENGTESLVV